MGVNGLWQILQPCARPTNLATLNRKRLAVDASIWIYQFLKAVRDKEGNALRSSHVVGFFRRICKLLWFGILPVFVFDGGAPTLKRSTLQARRQRREGRREDAVRTAGKLLAVQMHRIAEEDAEKRRKRKAVESQAGGEGGGGGGEKAATLGEDGLAEGEVLPSADKIVYASEMYQSQQERLQSRKFTKKDAYHLPDLDRPIEGMGRPEDPRIMSIDELEEYARQFHAGEDINLYDFSKIDFDGDFFKTLPPADRYYILNAARIRSRLRMGLSKEQLDGMFPDRMAFSRFQIERVRERNHLTQRLMIEAGMTGIDLTMGVNARVAGEKDREYILVKNDGAEGGWALGVVSRDKEQGYVHHKPIDVDALQFRYDGDREDAEEDEDDEDMDFQDVPIEGLNRLPKTPFTKQSVDGHADGDGDEDSLFVSSYQPAASLEKDENDVKDEKDGQDMDLLADEDEDINRAIAMSLRNQHGMDKVEEDEKVVNDQMLLEDVDISTPTWTQKAAETVPRPIMASSGRMVAHIVNNRSNAAVQSVVPADDDPDSDGSDSSELDIRAAMAAAAKKRKRSEEKPARPVLVDGTSSSQVKNPFGGPLPFEQLNWRTSIFEKKPVRDGMPAKPDAASSSAPMHAQLPTFASAASASAASAAVAAATAGETGSLEPESEDDDGLAGGFVIEEEEAEEQDTSDESMAEEVENSKSNAEPLPLPPWMADNTDIRAAMRQQKAYDDEINAEDREMAMMEEQIWQRRQETQIVEIDSSSDGGSDIEVLDAPPPKDTEKGPVADDQEPAEEPVEEPAAAKDNAVEESGEMMPEDTKGKDDSPMLDDVAESRPSSPEVEFEDVEIPVLEEQPAAMAAVAAIEGHMEANEQVPETGASVSADMDDDGLFTGEGDIDDHEFDMSDPEEEELLAQMAEEAEEHERFARTLNHRTEEEGLAAFEQELKALRSQQKKDRRDADEVTQVMVAECQALLRLFGIPYITAPMEAEAQCAELVSLGLVDGIVTDDSDTFLFGGTRVYKNMFNGNKFVECFVSHDLEKELYLSRDQLISLAQLLGSDYTEGLPGVGPVTAMEILSEFPGTDGLMAFRSWWEEVQLGSRSKEVDAASPFRRKFRRAQATKLFLPLGFPSPAVADAYHHPEVDNSTEPFQWGVPDLDGLRRFLSATIGWSQERTDEVLVPVIRDMNRREVEGTQSNITRYFTGAVGAGARVSGTAQMTEAQQQQLARIPEEFAPRHVPRNKSSGSGSSRRMAAAVNRMKALGSMSAETPAASVMRAGPEKAKTTRAEAATSAKSNTKARKRKPAGSPAAEEDVEDACHPNNGATEETDDEYQEGQDEPTRRRRQGNVKGKRAKA